MAFTNIPGDVSMVDTAADLPPIANAGDLATTADTAKIYVYDGSAWQIQGGGTAGVTALNGLSGSLTLVAGSNVTITPSGSNITIASTASGSGDVTGPASSVSGDIATFNGITGKIIQDSGKVLPTGAVVGTTDAQTLTNKSIDASTNILTNISNTQIKSAAAIAVNKLAATTANKALASDSSGFITASTTTDAELGFVSGVTSSIQTQLNGKQSTLTTGNLTDAGTDGISVTGGSGAVIGAGTSISQHVADTTHNGYLSSTDWNTFNSKGSGTVTSVSVASANGLAGSSSGGATPALTLSTTVTGVLKGNGTAISTATSGTDYSPGTSGNTTGIVKSTTGTGALTTAIAADFPTLNQNTTGTAANITASSNSTLTTLSSLVITESQVTNLTTDLAAKQSTTLTNSHILVGNGSNVATDVGVTGDVTIANTGATTVAKIAGTTVSGTTGSGNVVFSTSPTLTTPALGTPSALVGTNITGTAAGLTAGTVTTNANLTGPITSTGNATTVASQTGTGSTFVMNTSPTLVTPNIGTPSAGVLTNATGLPLTTGVTGTLPLANGGTSQTTAAAARTAAGLNIDQRQPIADADYTILATDRYVAMTSLTAPRTFTLPAANSVNPGQELFLADESGSASTTNIITLAASGTDTINGSANKTIRSAYGYALLRSNGTNMWFVGVEAIGRGGTGLSTTPTDGQLLIGKSSTSNYTLTTLTAGTGISITNGSGAITVATTGGGSGTVTSVDMTVPSDLSVSGNPITTSGTLTITRNTQSANTFMAGPTSGSAATPTFRAINTLDTPLPMIYFFGDGSTGALSISSGTTTLANDAYYTNLTISGTAVLNTAGFKVFVNGNLDLSNAPAGAIINNGGNGGAGAAAGTAGTAGLITGVGSTFMQPSGNAGGAGGTTTGSGAANAGTSSPCLGGGAAQGGAGGTGTAGNTGGAGGAASSAGGAVQIRRFETNFVKSAAAASSGFFAGGKALAGGGGGGDGTTSGGGGGGAGAAAGGIWISAYTLVKGSNATAAIIQAKGGNGGNGGSPSSGTGPAGGGGGSGGGGGYVFIAFFTQTGSTITNAIDISGGAGGTGGTSRGTATSGGTGGGNGQSGRVTIINIGAATSVETAPISATNGSAAVGLTGGVAASANTSQANL